MLTEPLAFTTVCCAFASVCPWLVFSPRSYGFWDFWYCGYLGNCCYCLREISPFFGPWISFLFLFLTTAQNLKNIYHIKISLLLGIKAMTNLDSGLMNCSMPGFLVLHYLPEFAWTHVHWVSDAIQPFHPLSSPSSCLQSFPASGSFPMSQLFTSGGQSTGASASASVLLRNIQGWFPLGLSGLILLSKGLSRVFSNTTVRKHHLPQEAL